MIGLWESADDMHITAMYISLPPTTIESAVRQTNVDLRKALKTQVLENASTEKASTKQRISQGWKTHVRKTQVRKNASTMQTLIKSLVLHKLVWCIFKWGGKVDYRLFFSEIT